jgi:hypothetical protein
MTPLTTAELQKLLAPREGPCTSVFLPTHRPASGAKEDTIRFKNLLTKAERKLGESLRSRDVTGIMEPLRTLARETRFWQGQLDGLAVFRSPDFLSFYRLPMALPERVVVADTFHVRPLIRFLQRERRYYVLALSRNHVTFYEGTSSGLTPVTPPDLPDSLIDAIGRDEWESFLNYHAASRAGTSTERVFHGHGGGLEDEAKEDLLRYFRVLDEALWRFLREETAPLILAGVGYYHPLYRSVSRYPHIVRRGVEGNFDHVTPKELFERVWPVVEEILVERQDEALREYQRVNGSGTSTDDVLAVAVAAAHGRVRRLMVARGQHLWGSLDRKTGEVTSNSHRASDTQDDVLDDLAELVLARGGEVLMFEPDRMPTASPVAAVMRW